MKTSLDKELVYQFTTETKSLLGENAAMRDANLPRLPPPVGRAGQLVPFCPVVTIRPRGLISAEAKHFPRWPWSVERIKFVGRNKFADIVTQRLELTLTGSLPILHFPSKFDQASPARPHNDPNISRQ